VYYLTDLNFAAADALKPCSGKAKSLSYSRSDMLWCARLFDSSAQARCRPHPLGTPAPAEAERPQPCASTGSDALFRWSTVTFVFCPRQRQFCQLHQRRFPTAPLDLAREIVTKTRLDLEACEQQSA
jgi:hypothetical protein